MPKARCSGIVNEYCKKYVAWASRPRNCETQVLLKRIRLKTPIPHGMSCRRRTSRANATLIRSRGIPTAIPNARAGPAVSNLDVILRRAESGAKDRNTANARSHPDEVQISYLTTPFSPLPALHLQTRLNRDRRRPDRPSSRGYALAVQIVEFSVLKLQTSATGEASSTQHKMRTPRLQLPQDFAGRG